MLDAVKKYIEDQIAIYEKISHSFPALHMGDDHIMAEVFAMHAEVRDTLEMLMDCRGIAGDVSSYEELKKELAEELEWFYKKLKIAVEDDARFGTSRPLGTVSASVREARTPVKVISSIQSYMRSMELQEYAE